MALDPVALTALIISLVALVATFAQLLQQYFATADGYRQCLPEVMGDDWGNKTSKRMRWRELRYETLYYVPSISVDLFDPRDIGHARTETYAFYQDWDFLDLSEKYTLIPEEKTDREIQDEDLKEMATGSGEKVCWVALLKRLRIAQGDIKKVYDAAAVWKAQQTGVPRRHHTCATPAVVCLRILKRSWDFMPPEVVRPLCMSTVSDIAVLAIRLDMDWKEFNPVDGKMLAEGNGQLITSRIVRSLGLCLEYTRTERVVNFDANEKVRARRSIGDLLLGTYLPVAGVSDLIFGVVAGNKNLDCFQRAIGTIDEITAFLDFLDNTGDEHLNLTENLMSSMKMRPGWIPGFNDVIPLTATKMSSVLSRLRNLPMPNLYSAGLLRTREGLQVFCQRLHNYIAIQKDKISEQLLLIQDCVSNFERNHSQQWYANDSTWAYVPMDRMILPEDAYEAAERYQKEIHDALDAAEAFLKSINHDPSGSIRNDRKDQKSGFCYDTLLVEHLRMAVLAYEKIENKGNYPDHWVLPVGRDWLSASMHVYWDEFPNTSVKVATYTGCTVDLAIEAWVTMIFRAFCWHHCHHLMPTKMILPSEWHGSQMPVYIG